MPPVLATAEVQPIELGGGIVSNTRTNGKVRGIIGKVRATLDTNSSCNRKESQADGFLATITGTGTTDDSIQDA